MPRYSIEPRQSPREKKQAQMQNFAEQDLRQQQLDQGQQAQLMNQLSSIYGLQQQAQLAPLHQQQLQADILSKQYETQMAPQVLGARLAAELAQKRYYESQAEGKVTPHDLMVFEKDTGHPYITPEQRQIEEQKKAQEAAQARAIEEARMKTPLPQHPGPAVQPERQGGLIGTGPQGGQTFLDWLYDQILPSPESMLENQTQLSNESINPMNLLFGKKKPTRLDQAANAFK